MDYPTEVGVISIAPRILRNPQAMWELAIEKTCHYTEVMIKSTHTRIREIAQIGIITLLCAATMAFGNAFGNASALAYRVEGVSSADGKVILEYNYHRVKLLPGNLILAEELNLLVPERPSHRCKILTAGGIEITPPLPPDCTLKDIYIDSEAVPRSTLKPGLLKLPSSTILTIAGPDGFGLCTPDGKTILEPKFHMIGQPVNGLFPVFNIDQSNLQIEFILDAKSRNYQKLAVTDRTRALFYTEIGESTNTQESSRSSITARNPEKAENPEKTENWQKALEPLTITRREIPRYQNIQGSTGDYWICGNANKSTIQNLSKQSPTSPQTLRHPAAHREHAARQSHFGSPDWHRCIRPWHDN